MIKNMITYLKLGKYIEHFKLLCFCGLAIFANSIMYFVISFDNQSVATLNMAFGLNYITIILSSSIFNQMIGSSPLRRFMEITAPNIVNVVTALLIYILLCISTARHMNKPDTDIVEAHISGVLGIILALLFIICIHKHIIAGIILMLFAMPTLIFCKPLYDMSIFNTSTLTVLYIKGFILLVIGLVLCIALRHWFEKHSYMSIYEKQAARRI